MATTTTFKDRSSRQSVEYSRYRPGYPADMIAWVASRAPDRALAVDCASGNGQSVSLVAAAPAVHRFYEDVVGDYGPADATLRLNCPIHLRLGCS